MECPLCYEPNGHSFFKREDKTYGKREYCSCPKCGLIFLLPELRFKTEQEKARYDSHENDPKDPDYLKFLSRLAEPVSKKLKKGASGLDFGCGPGPAMKKILEEKGFKVENYDPIYFFDETLLIKQYDFITCSETVEHFYQPRKEFELFKKLLKPKGLLAIMTEVLCSEKDFPGWWYHKDPTHVCFYRPKTFEWIAKTMDWEYSQFTKNIVFFK